MDPLAQRMPTKTVTACEDCNDADPSVYPDADERCNGVDNDCNGEIDDDTIDALPYFIDTDGDGFGLDSEPIFACDPPDGYANNADDCDDENALIYPDAVEECSDVEDRDCDGTPGFVDVDGDGFGACDDCDDLNPDVHPDAEETCDSIDNNCDGVIDEAEATDAETWYPDADGDGFGSEESRSQPAMLPTGPMSEDWDDDDVATFPGAPEACEEEIDRNCDGPSVMKQMPTKMASMPVTMTIPIRQSRKP